MDEDRKNWMIACVISIALILAFLIFAEPFYESMDLAGKRAFMLVFQVVFLTIAAYVLLPLLQRYQEKKQVNSNERTRRT